MAFAWSLCLKAACCFLFSYLKTNLKLALKKLQPTSISDCKVNVPFFFCDQNTKNAESSTLQLVCV